MARIYKTTYRAIQDGEEVKASVANRPLDDLLNNIQYLKDRIDSIGYGSALTLDNQILARANIAIGTPLYQRSDGTWDVAYVKLVGNPDGSLYTLSSESYVSGVLQDRTGNVGNICLFGSFTTDDTILNLIESDYESGGIYYLSTNTNGGLTVSKNAIPVRVCTIVGPDADNKYRITVNPEPRSVLESHSHVKVQLQAVPAGEVNYVPKLTGHAWGELEPEGPFPGVIHEIINENTSIAGWLPVSSPVFAGKAIPSGAKFGYNIEADPNVKAIWPPLPADSAYLEENGIGLGDNKVIINTDGIWWMDNTYGNAPWPTNWPSESSSESLSGSTSYPLWEKRLNLWLTRLVAAPSIDVLNKYISIRASSGISLVPNYVGPSITKQYIDTFNMMGYKFAGFAGSGSEIDYRLTYNIGTEACDFTRYPAIKLFFKLLFYGNPGSAHMIVNDLLGSCVLTLTQINYLAIGQPGSANSNIVITPISFNTTDYLVRTLDPVGGQVLYLATNIIELIKPETLIFSINWTPSTRLTYSDDECVYLLDVKPVLSI